MKLTPIMFEENTGRLLAPGDRVTVFANGAAHVVTVEECGPMNLHVRLGNGDDASVGYEHVNWSTVQRSQINVVEMLREIPRSGPEQRPKVAGHNGDEQAFIGEDPAVALLDDELTAIDWNKHDIAAMRAAGPDAPAPALTADRARSLATNTSPFLLEQLIDRTILEACSAGRDAAYVALSAGEKANRGDELIWLYKDRGFTARIGQRPGSKKQHFLEIRWGA